MDFSITKKLSELLLKCKFKYALLSKITKSLWLTNFIFQRILGINRSCGFQANFTSRFVNIEKLEFYKDITTLGSFAISGSCYIQATNGIKLGRNFLCAPGVKIISANHDINDVTCTQLSKEKVSIGDNVWIGANAIILPGVALGNNCIIGAGSVVTKSFPSNCIIVGNPAKVLSSNKKS